MLHLLPSFEKFPATAEMQISLIYGAVLQKTGKLLNEIHFMCYRNIGAFFSYFLSPSRYAIMQCMVFSYLAKNV